MALSRRSFLRAAALSMGAISMGATTASASAVTALPSTLKDVLQVVVAFPRTDRQRAALPNFDDTHAIVDGGVELLLWPGDLARLQATGMPYEVRIADLLAHEAAEASTAAAVDTVVAVPGGVTDYRDLADFHAVFEQLERDAAEHPGLHARVITLPIRSFEGREIKGVEIWMGEEADGRGIAYVDGCHHAREWPAAEYPALFARWLVDEAVAGNGRVTSMLSGVKVRIVPVINVDGFAYSRSWAGTVMDNSTLGIVAGGQGAYVRKTQRNNPLVTTGVDSPIFYGVDPNRNYAYLWGGTTGSLVNGVDAPIFASTSSNPTDQTYYGTEPFSEPEVANNRDFFLHNNVITYLSNHTSGRLILRPWGHTTDACPDEALLVEMGDAMSRATETDDLVGYESKIGLGLYPTLGTSNDWAYAATGTLGYVIEHSTAFHPGYFSFHGPGTQWPYVMEMFLRAAEYAGDPRCFATLTGKITDASGAALAGTITLAKAFTTPFAGLEEYQGTGQLTAMASELEEAIELTLPVGPTGEWEWHVNPSTRPIAEIGNTVETYRMTVTTAVGSHTQDVEVVRGQALALDVVIG